MCECNGGRPYVKTYDEPPPLCADVTAGPAATYPRAPT